MAKRPIQTTSLTLTASHRGCRKALILRRQPDKSFLGGYSTFIAGKLDPQDSRIAVDDPFLDLTDHRASALRECFEEVGLLCQSDQLTTVADPQARRIDDWLSPSTPLATTRLNHLGWWRSPQWMGPTFETAFFKLHLHDADPDLLEALPHQIDRREYLDAQWMSPQAVVDDWRAGRRLLTPPIHHLLLDLDDPELPLHPGPTPQPIHRPIEAVERIALATETLPPATHTNAFLVGDHLFALIDPGTDDPASLKPLIDHIHQRLQRGHRFQAILLTHHHGDHISGVPTLLKHFPVPLAAHPKTLERLPFFDQITDSVALHDRQTIELVDRPLTALLTPGHAPGHLAFELPDIGAIICGDLVASEGTILIDPPDGHMGHYLQSLRALRNLNPTVLFPAHGDPITTPIEHLDHYLHHRQQREEQILAALRQHGPASAHELVPFVYTDVPAHLWPLAARSLRAHLIHLAEQGLATSSGKRYRAPL